MAYGKNEFVDLHNRTKLSASFFFISIISYLLSIVCDFRLLKLVGKAKLVGYIPDQDLEAIDNFQVTVGLMILISLILTLIFFLIWFHRAYSNLPSFGADIEHNTGMAVGYFFIPIANFFIPHTILKEIWEKSITRGNYGKYKPKVTSSIIVLWWVFIIGSGVMTKIDSMLYARIASIEDINLSTYFSIATSLVFIVHEIIAIIIIHSINKMQQVKREAVMINPELEKETKPILSPLK